jgi:uncharacterized linocin/CFP29 family protein
MDNEVMIDTLGKGNIADAMLACNFDHNMLRPFLENGKAFVNNSDGKTTRQVANATLLKDEWIHLDRAVTQVARERLNFVNDLVSMGLTYNLPNAMGKTVIQYQNASDINDASVSMDGLSKSDSDRMDYDLTSMPVPIIHKDVYFSAREIAVSRNGGMPLDTTVLEIASRKVSEAAEKLHVGTYGTYKFGGGNVYGLRNFPDRGTTTYADWAGSTKDNEDRLKDILGFLDDMRGVHRYGPYGIYISPNLEQYLDEDYKANSDITFRERILKIGSDGNSQGKIKFIKALDYLVAGDIMVVELKSDTIQTVVGMPTTLLQWSTDGGMKYCFKVMSIMVPRCRADYNGTGSCGILHATVASA